MEKVYIEIPLRFERHVLPYLYRYLSNLEDFSFFMQVKDSYTVIGVRPERVFKLTRDRAEILDERGVRYVTQEELFKEIDDIFKQNSEERSLPFFSGGIFGYIGYDAINRFEDLYHDSSLKFNESHLPIVYLSLFDEVILVDHKNQKLFIVKTLKKREDRSTVFSQLKSLREKIENFSHPQKSLEKIEFEDFSSNTSREEFIKMVKVAKEYIAQGEVFQIVLSHRFSFKSNMNGFELFQALLRENPSPYMFFANYPELTLIGSSPEILIKTEGKRVITKPLAGTRPRGKTLEEDLALERELLSDEKERAEHIMLVDLARNDLGRICKVGTVKVTELMKVEYFPKVMHIASRVEGIMEDNTTPLEVLRAAFPAGTLTGTPKIRAVELINLIEKEARGIYGGATGLIDYSGDMEMCITIRSIVKVGNRFYVQAGAGIVADSDPEKEYQETLNKALGMFKAIKRAVQKGGVRV